MSMRDGGKSIAGKSKAQVTWISVERHIDKTRFRIGLAWIEIPGTAWGTLMRDLYRLHIGGYPRVVEFSGTEEGNDYHQKCTSAYIHHGMDLEKFKTWKKINHGRATKNHRKLQRGRGKIWGPQLVWICDWSLKWTI